MNWKLLVSSIVASVVIIAIILLSYYSYIPLDIGIIISVLTALPSIIFNLADYFLKSQVKLKIKNAHFIAKGFDHNYVGYQLKALLINKGKKICLDLNDVSIVIKDSDGNSPSLLKVIKKMTDNHGEITLDKEQMRDIGHCWIDKKDQLINSLTELRQDDPFYLIFPYETKWGGLVGNDKKTFLSSSYSHEYLLDLKNEVYTVEIKVKGEDIDKNTISKEEKIKVKPTINKFTTTKDTEIGGLNSQISQLQQTISRKESELSRKESETSSLTKQIEEMVQASNQLEARNFLERERIIKEKKDLNKKLEQANNQIKGLRRNIAELERKNKIYEEYYKKNPTERVK